MFALKSKAAQAYNDLARPRSRPFVVVSLDARTVGLRWICTPEAFAFHQRQGGIAKRALAVRDPEASFYRRTEAGVCAQI